MGSTTESLACTSASLREFSWAELAAMRAEPQHLAMLLRIVREDYRARRIGLIPGYASEPAQEYDGRYEGTKVRRYGG
jgi:hypothetical protein